ncbi:hypothetical protein TrST_g3727 [Triparma strigata]|uniref:PPM-type phosphatase domain-containing protein n=1 Tax=Triparma strigata TaxID=1606541 RepID=A0A9W7F1L1_9STRA|nr:hypothetical protein TrST_g3727 [Triparma strigata]
MHMLKDPDKTLSVSSASFAGKFGNCLTIHTSMQGFRPSMEDSHFISYSNDNPYAVFAVFDGHGGDEIALEVGSKFGDFVFKDKGAIKIDDMDALKAYIDTAFRSCDEHLRTLGHMSGSTANVVFVTPGHIICGNIGDSRSVLCRSGMAMEMSVDHKPTDEGETERIKKAGGSVIRGRVCGGVAVSRSFGDFDFKQNKDLDASKQQISCCPDFITRERDTTTDEFIIICCDGVWDVISNEACVRFVRTRLQAGISDLEVISGDLLEYCLENGSKDNMTCIIVLLDAGRELIRKNKPECLVL